MSYRVFISHGWHDRWIAGQMAALLKERSVDAFIDIFDVKKGDRIEQRILEALPACDELVALLTPWSVDRNWVWTEIAAAWALKKRFVGVLFGVTLREIEEKHGGCACLGTTNVCHLDEFTGYLDELDQRGMQKK